MNFADELRNNYNPPEEKYYFKEIKYIIRTIKECAEVTSVHSHSLSGYYSYGGYEEGEGIYAELKLDRANAAYYHIDDFGAYKERIISLYQQVDDLLTVENVAKALKEIKKRLISEGFKNVVVEERIIGERDVAYNRRKMTSLERMKANRRLSGHIYKKGEECCDYVKMPLYNLYISIEW